MNKQEHQHTSPEFCDINLGVVCPMANESKTAQEFINQVIQHCKNFKSVFFFVILDNKSSDGTYQLLKDWQQTPSELNLIWAPENTCVVDAYIRGYREALNTGCDWILEIDAGFSHKPEDIPQFFEKMAEGYDCVFGSRYHRGASFTKAPWTRRFISKAGSVLTNVLLETKLKDMTSGFELFTEETLKMVLDKGIKSRAHFFQTEIKAYCRKLKYAEVPIQYSEPSENVSFAVLLDAFKNLFRLFLMRLKGSL
ncbi:MAG: glycosyltransferase [Planctomycetota bacterium]|jgi:dolichol-phosphate mannosyltransferase